MSNGLAELAQRCSQSGGTKKITYHRLERRHFAEAKGKLEKKSRSDTTPADRIATQAGGFLTLVMLMVGRSSTFLCVLKIGRLVQRVRQRCASPDWDLVEER